MTLAPPPLRDDCFALPQGVDWVPVDEALKYLEAALEVVVTPETVPLSQAAGRTLAEGVSALRDNPPGANAAVDGYGFAMESLGPPPHVLPLTQGRAAAGAPFDGTVPAGSALRILTGALLPPGVDTIVLEEDVRSDGSAVAFQGGIKPGANTRQAGEDVTAGELLLPKGRRLTPGDVSLLAATGHAEVSVFKPLRVAILSTGDEVVDPAATTPPDRTHDANRPLLRALVEAWGGKVLDLGIAPDDREAIHGAFDRAASEADVLITSGGASAGDEDHVSALLTQTGFMALWRVALKPGRPLALGLWNGTPVFGLPGNPVAVLVCALIFARPALSLMGGGGWVEPEAYTVPAAFAKSKKPGRREYLRARMRDGKAEVFSSEGSGRISGLSWAEGLVELADGPAQIEDGSPVRYLPFSGFGL